MHTILMKYHLCGDRYDSIERLHPQYALQIAQLMTLPPSTETHTRIRRRTRLLHLGANFARILAEGDQFYPYEGCASFADSIVF
jgi:hypothetical protein